MLPKQSAPLIIALILTTLLPEDGYACADGIGCAVVKTTDDGFVALRREPSASSALVEVLRPYEVIIIFEDSCNPTPKWTPVESVPRVDGDWEYNKQGVTTGYVKSTLIERTRCPMDLPQ